MTPTQAALVVVGALLALIVWDEAQPWLRHISGKKVKRRRK